MGHPAPWVCLQSSPPNHGQSPTWTHSQGSWPANQLTVWLTFRKNVSHFCIQQNPYIWLFHQTKKTNATLDNDAKGAFNCIIQALGLLMLPCCGMTKVATITLGTTWANILHQEKCPTLPPHKHMAPLRFLEPARAAAQHPSSGVSPIPPSLKPFSHTVWASSFSLYVGFFSTMPWQCFHWWHFIWCHLNPWARTNLLIGN